jgi:hypothetical protein
MTSSAADELLPDIKMPKSEQSPSTRTPYHSVTNILLCLTVSMFIFLTTIFNRSEIPFLRSSSHRGKYEVHEKVNGFDFSSYYGIPEDLPVADNSVLVNHTELNLDTNFNTSAPYTVREYTFDVTQALASPDGE